MSFLETRDSTRFAAVAKFLTRRVVLDVSSGLWMFVPFHSCFIGVIRPQLGHLLSHLPGGLLHVLPDS